MSALAEGAGPSLAKQLKDLENERRMKVKKAKGAAGKNKSKQKEVEAAVNAVFDAKRKDLEAKFGGSSQEQEGEGGSADQQPQPQQQQQQQPASAPASSQGDVEGLVQDLAASSIPDKKEKARLKKLKKQQKKREEEARLEHDMANAGPSNREVESSAIIKENDFSGLNLSIVDVEADGHCLYRALGHHLGQDYESVRSLCADFLASNANSYAPFLSEEDGGFEDYVSRVRSSAEWGGELELRAISECTKRRIKVFNSSRTPRIIGEAYGEDTEIKVSYHRHYYDLGEHYNVVS